METPVVFENPKGEKLFGIVHAPRNGGRRKNRTGINLLNPGIKYRVAPNRLNVTLARKLCRNGYYVLRFDPSGIGDSEGELPDNILVPDIWEKIQTGLFVQDTIAANSFFIESYNISNLILAGNCGGAITALLTAAKDSRVNLLCLIDVPVNLRTSKMSFADKVKEGGQRANWLYDEYIKRVFKKKSWYRFITMKTDYKSLKKVLKMKVREKFWPGKDACIPSQELERLCSEGKLNRLFYESFQGFVGSDKSILFLLAENDPGTEIFQHYFVDQYLKKSCQDVSLDSQVQIATIDNANHVYALQESQKSMMNKVIDWINNQ